MSAALLAALSACSLLTSLDGLAGAEVESTAEASVGEGGMEATAPVDAAPGDGAAPSDGSDARFVAYGQAVLADAPLAYWRFEETALPTAKDERGLHDAAYVFAPSLGEPGVAGGRAVRLPAGQRAHITEGSSAFNFGGKVPYAVEMWIKLSKLSNYQWLASTEGPTVPRSGWSLFVNSTGGTLFEVWGVPFSDGGSSQRRGAYAVVAPTPIVVGPFQHVVMSFNGAVTSLWVDGVKRKEEADSTSAPDTGPLILGCRRAASLIDCVDDGVLDEVAIYDHALSGARILAHYDFGKP